MAICNHLAPNGEKSILYQQLEEEFGPDKAHDLWTAVRTQQFLNKEGEWYERPENATPWAFEASKNIPLDVNGEPLAEWVAQKLGMVQARLELKPGMYANAGQTVAVNNIMKFLDRDYEPVGMDQELKDLYLLEGGAGVGKTTSINRALEDFRGKIIGATVSDEARGVLQQNMIGKETLTIAKLLGLVPDRTGAEMVFRKRNAEEEDDFRQRGKEDPIESARLVVIDEASMVDKATWQLLMDIKPAGTKIIFLGDRTQLPPIKEDISNAFSKLEGTPNYSKLTETMRFAEGMPIFQVTERLFADNVRHQQATGKLLAMNPLANPALELKDSIQNGEAVLYRTFNTDMIADIAKEFKQATSNKDVIVIADKNADVAQYNQMIRKEIYGDTTEEFKVGERIRMDGPFVSNGTVIADNNLKGTIKNKRESEIRGTPVIHVEVEFEKVDRNGNMGKKTETIPIVKPGHEIEYQAALAKLKDAALKNRSLWRDFYQFKETFGKIDYAYAMTVHKVQGSTYKNVYVMEYEIYRRGTPRTGLEINQMMRTATSRPTTKLVIVTDKVNDTSTTLVNIPERSAKPVEAAPVQQQEVQPKVIEPGGINVEDGAYSGMITKLGPNDVFVFGSNPLGVNGNEAKGTGGAALVASRIADLDPGEKMDNKLSRSGKAWGLTTVAGPGKKLSKTPDEIKTGIKKLYDYAATQPDKRFFVAYQGKEGKNLNGYSNKQLAEMFSAFPIPANVIFEKEFNTLLNRTQQQQPPTAQPEPGVYEEFGTKYRFAEKDGAITGEYKQGNGLWKPMNAKNAKAKYEQYVDKVLLPEVNADALSGTSIPTQEEVTAALAKKAIPQNYKDRGVSIQGTEMRTRVPGRTSGEMIRNGERTETTRSSNQFGTPHIGDLEVHEDKQGKMLVRVTSEAFKPNKQDFDKYEGWADEQWERSQHHFTDKWFSYRYEYLGDIKDGKLVPKVGLQLIADRTFTKLTPAQYTNHSGGAIGSDADWDIIGNKYGFINHNHYLLTDEDPEVSDPRLKKKGVKPVSVSASDMAEGQQKVTIAARQMGRIEATHQVKNSKLIRNWAQVKYADAIFAVSHLLEPGDIMDHGKRALIQQVKGGTGYAVQMAINESKPVFVFDQNKKQWYRWNAQTNDFSPTGTPTLTQNFAGIGTREINVAGQQAIEDVYKATLAKPAEASAQPVSAGPITKTLGTKDKMSTEDMTTQIKALYAEAEANPDKNYKVPYENLGQKKTLDNGYTSDELANLMDNVGDIPPNVQFTPGFGTLIENSYRRIIEGFTSGVPVEFINVDDHRVLATANQILIQKTGPDGKPAGFFDPGQQKEIIDTVVSLTERKLRNDPMSKANALLWVFKALAKQKDKFIAEGNTERAQDFISIYNARVRIAEDAMNQLKGMGMRIDSKTIDMVKTAVQELRMFTEKEKPEFTADNPQVDGTIDEYTGEFLASVGKISAEWGDNTFELDPKDTASARVKFYMGTIYEMDRGIYTVDPTGLDLTKAGIDLSTIGSDPVKAQALARLISRKPFWYKDEAASNKIKEWMEAKVPMFAKENFLGMSKTADANEIFKESINLLGDRKQGTTFQEAMSILGGSTNPTVQKMALDLQQPTTDKALQNEFMTVMSKQYARFITGIFGDSYKGMVLNPISSNRNGQRDTMVHQWQENQKLGEITVIAPSGERVLDVNRINERWIPILRQAQARTVDEWNTVEAKESFIDSFGGILNLLGIPVTDEMMTDLYENPRKWSTSDTPAALVGQRLSDGSPTGMLSIFIMKAAGLMNLNDTDEDQSDALEKTTISQRDNPIFTENELLSRLTNLVAKYSPVLYSSNHRNSEGKSVHDWGMNTKLSNTFREFSKDPESFAAFAAKMDQVDIAKNNWLIRKLRDSPAQIERMELNYFDGMRPKWRDRGTTRDKMSDREQMLMSILLFQNRGNSHNKNLQLVNYMSLTHGDKTMTPIFHNMPRLPMGQSDIMPVNIIGTMDSAMYNVFKSEYDRITKHENITFNNAQYQKGKGLFYMIPDFNFEGMQSLVKQGVITQQEMNMIYPAGMNKLTKIISDANELTVINKVLTNFVNNMVNNTLQKWTDNGIIKPDSTSFDYQYLWKLNGVEGLRKQRDNSYRDLTGRPVKIEDAISRLSIAAAKDYAINHFLFNTATSQLFYGDPAANWKGSTTASQLDQVESTFKEYTKRLAKDIAPRTDLYWEAGKRKYNMLTLKDVKTFEKYLKGVVDVYADSATNSTDAQEITTVQEKLDVMMAAGQIPAKVYTEMSEIIQKAGPGGYYEFTLPAHKDIIFQPEKPIYAGTQEPEHGALLTNYIKSSAWAMYPPFTQNREIDKLRQFMEKNNIQRSSFESAGKLGNPINPLEVFDTDGKWVEPTEANWQGAYQQLSRDGFGIQQEVPYDEDKDAIKILTQMNDNIVEGILDMKDFNLFGTSMTGKQVKVVKEQIRKDMIQENLDDLHRRLNVDENGTVDLEKIFDMMTDKAKTDIRGSYTTNEIQSLLIRNADGTPAIPPMFNTAADRFETMLMSIMNGVKDVKMPGKSLVQASSTGIRISEGADLSKVVRSASWDGSPLKMLRIEDGVVKPGQVIVPFNFVDSDGNKLKLEDYTNPDGTINHDKLPVELLQLIAARIPNQKHSSMLPVEIVGFTPANMGDIAFIPGGLIKQMGADFDVDKLYNYKRPYNVGITDGVVTPVTQNDGHLPGMQRAYFDIHWAILNHLDMISKVLQPLDLEDLIEESKSLKQPRGNYLNFYDHMSQLEDFQRGKDAKRLVGSTSWAVKFNARIQDKNLRYGTLKEVGTRENGSPVLEETDAHIEVIDEHTGKTKSLGKLSGNGTSYYTKKDGDTITKDSARSKVDTHAMVQTESVDNAKSRTLDNLNLTPETYKAVQALIQMETSDGWAANSKYWTRLTTQPIIWEFSKLMKQGNDSMSGEYDPRLAETTFHNLEMKYGEMATESGLSTEQEAKVKDIKFSPQILQQAKKMEGEDFALHQLAALEMFKKLYGIGSRMFILEAQFNQDVSGSGSNLFEAMDKLRTFESIDQPLIRDAMQIYKDAKDNLTEVGYTFDSTVGNSVNLVNQVFPYQPLSTMFNKLMDITGRDLLTTDQQKRVLRALRSATFTTGDHFWFDAQADRVRLMYGADSLGKRLAEAKAGWGVQNPFLKSLNTTIGTSEIGPDYIEYQAAGKASTVDRQSRTSGWLHLLLSEVPEQKQLGEDLLRYSLLTGGIQDQNSFVQFLPASYMIATDFTKMLKTIEENLKASDGYENDGLMMQFLQHNPDLVQQVDPKLFGKLEGTREYPESFELTDEKKNALFTPMKQFVSFKSKAENKWILYMRNPVSTSIWYTRIDTLGNQYSDEYNGEAAAGQRSIFQENRALAELIPGIEDNNPLQSLSDFKQNSFSFGNFNNGVSHYSQIGVKSGGIKEATAGLEAISMNPEIPQFTRLAARLLARANTLDAQQAANVLTNYGEIRPTQIVVKASNSKFEGGSSDYGNKVVLNSKSTNNVQEAAQAFTHEMMHNRLQHIFFMTGNAGGEVASQMEKPYWKRQIEDYRKKYPEVAKIADDLQRIRYEGMNALRVQWGEEKMRKVTENLKNGNISSDDELLLYSLSSIDELTAHLFEHKETAEFLNNVQSSTNETLLSKIWNALGDMLRALADAIGVKVKDKSLLKQAVIDTMRLVDHAGSKDIDFTEALIKMQTISVSTQIDAENIKKLLNNTYGREAELQKLDDKWLVTFNNYKFKPNKVYGQRGKILTKLNEQRNEINNSKNHIGIDPKAKVKMIARSREINEQIQEIHRNQDLDVITNIAYRQLEWVDETLRSAHPTTVDVNMALNITHTWENLLNILYGDQPEVGEVNASFAKIQEEAFKRRVELANTRSREVLNEQFRGDVELTDKDYKEDLVDIDMLSANVLALTRAKPLLVQAVAVVGKREAGNRDEHISRNTIKLQQLEAKMKLAGLTPEMMTQESSDGKSLGMVDRLTRDWYQELEDSRTKLQDALEGKDRSDALTDEQRHEQKAKLWNDYWDKMKKKSAFVDVRSFFDITTGARVSGTSYDEAFKRLTDLVGDENYAKELITKAEDTFKDYLEQKESMKLHLDTTEDLTEEEKKDKDTDQQEAALKAKIDKQMKRWLEYNSPVDFLNNVEKGKNVRLNSEGDKWIQMVPRKEHTQYYSEKFQNIAKDPKKMESFNEYKSILTEMQSYLPIEVQEELPEDFLPVVPKDTTNWLAQVLGKIRNWDATLLQALTATDAEEASRLRPDKIPVMYTQSTGLTKAIADRSTDMIRVLEVFSMMALQHKYMGNVLNTINIAENVLKNVESRRLNGQEAGKPLRNLRDALKYWKDMMVFKKPKELQGKVSSPIYSLDLAKQAKIQKDITNLMNEKKELQEQELEAHMDGKYSLAEEIQKKVDGIDEKLTEYEKMKRQIYGSKLGDLLVSINQMKALSYNPFSAASNFTFGAISLAINAKGNIDYDDKTMFAGYNVMIHSMKKYWLFNEMGDETAQKVHALMNRYGIMGDIVDTQYGQSNLKTKKHSPVLDSIKPFQWQKAGDYFIKGALMVAMMKKKMVKVPLTDKKVDQKIVDHLKDKAGADGMIQVYRGVMAGGELGTGQFWTTSRSAAEWYAGRATKESGTSNIIEKKISLQEAINSYMGEEGNQTPAQGTDIFSIADSQYKDIPLWEAMTKEGKWDTEKYGENKQWYSEDDINEQTESNRYRERIRQVSTMAFGNQDKNSPLLAKRNWLWRLAGQFRMSWFPEGVATRFKGEYPDITLGRTVKGRWTTYADLGILNSGLLVCKQMLAALPGVKTNPFDGTTIQSGVNKGKPLMESEVDMENMRKNFAGLAWTVLFTAGILMIRAAGGDKKHRKDDDDRKLQLLINMLIRNQQDLQLYSSPAVFNTISGNFIPATQVLVDYWAAMKATANFVFKDTSQDKHAVKKLINKIAKAGIPHPVFTLIPKTETMYTRDLDMLQR